MYSGEENVIEYTERTGSDNVVYCRTVTSINW
jgi:hypothetical protein